MDIDDPAWPLLDDFVRQLADGRTPATIRHHARVRRRLYSFLDTADMTLGLGGASAVLLEAERQFHDSGAFWQLFGPDELVGCLPSFLHETWLPAGAQEARHQVTVVGRLLTFLDRSGSIDRRRVASAFRQAKDAVEQARRGIAERPVPAVEASLPLRFRQEEGPRW
jgi:hypothetical protein